MSSTDEAFAACSSDGDNMTRKQTYTALCMCNKNPTGVVIASFFEECEIEDSEGTITLAQFGELCGRPSVEEASEEELKQAFQIFDKNGDGTIDKEELKTILSGVKDTTGIENDLDDATVDEIWSAIDTDSSGSLSYTELVQYLVDNDGSLMN